MTDGLKFSSSQKKRLSTLGLSCCQISELENNLPIAEIYIRRPTAKEYAESELDALSKALGKAKDSLRRMTTEAASNPGKSEAIQRVQISDFELHGKCQSLESALQAVTIASNVISDAEKSLKAAPTRRHTKWRAVEFIEDALLRGFIKEHDGHPLCSGQLIPDTVLSFSSATAGASPSLN